jgi:hypothetical protein
MTIPEHYNHRVQVKLKLRDIFELEHRLEELNYIRAWLDELVEWQPDAFTIKYYDRGNGAVIDVWFADERHAMICALRWS